MKSNFKNGLLAALVFSLLAGNAVFADINSDVEHLQQRWAEINYQLEGKTQQSAFEQLMNEANAIAKANPGAAEPLIWSGIIKSTYAGVKGGLGALALAKESKADLEKAISINGDALLGSAYTSLGALYFNVPGWPVGFGDDKKAEKLLKQALTLNPSGIDSNYFYADYLISEKKYAQAREYLLKAQQAPARPGRSVADAGRKQEIAAKLAAIATKK